MEKWLAYFTIVSLNEEGSIKRPTIFSEKRLPHGVGNARDMHLSKPGKRAEKGKSALLLR